jgi:hypothetical protein
VSEFAIVLALLAAAMAMFAIVLALLAAAMAMFAMNKPRLDAVVFRGEGTGVMEAANATIIAKERGNS